MRRTRGIDPFAKFRKDKEFQKIYREERARIALALQIIELRKKQRLTQSALAHKAGLKQSALARIESGRSNATIATLGRVAGALKKNLVFA